MRVRPSRAFSLRFIAVIGACLYCHPAFGQTLGLQLTATPDGTPLTELTVALRPGATQTTTSFYVKHRRGAAVQDLRLVAAVDGAIVELTPDGGTVGSTATLPAGGLLRYSMLVKDVASTRVTGDITALAGSDAQRLVSLTITRPPNEVLAIQGAAQAGIERTTDVTAFQLPLTIVSKAADDVNDLRVAVDVFAHETGQTVAPTVLVGNQPSTDTTVHSISGNGFLPLLISANLEAGGVYTSSIRLTYGGRSTVIPVKVTRSRVAPTVVFDPVPDMAESVWRCKSGSGNDVTFRVPATEVAGRGTQLERPTLVLTRQEGATNVQAKYDDFTIDGNPAGSTSFAPGQSRALVVSILGLEDCGQFAATLRFRGAGAESKDVATKLWIRRHVFWALLVLFGAVLVGEVVRRVRTEYLVGLESRADLAAISEELNRLVWEAQPDAEDLDSLDELQEHLASLDREVARKPTKNIDTPRKEIEAKVRLVNPWLVLRRRARAAGWPFGTDDKLRVVQQFLQRRGATDAGPSQTALEEASALLDQGPGLKSAIDELSAAAVHFRTVSLVSEAGKKAIDEAISKVRAPLNAGKLTEADAAYSEALVLLLETASKELIHRAEKEPPGVDPTAWAELQRDLEDASQKVKTATSPKEAIAAYKDAYARYIKLVGTEATGSLRAASLPSTVTAFGPAVEAWQGVIVKAETGDIAGAQAEYLIAADLVSAVETEAGVQLPVVVPPIPPLRIPERPTPTPGLPLARVFFPTRSSSADLHRRKWWITTLLFVFACGVAAASGLLALYFPDYAWGDWQDLVVAALWGLGVYAVTNATYKGAPAILERIGVGGS